MTTLRTRSHLGRAALALALVASTACGVGPFPRRRAGSDITLPPSTTEWLIEAALKCATPVKADGAAGARDVAVCRKSTGDTVPNPTAPLPPAKTP